MNVVEGLPDRQKQALECLQLEGATGSTAKGFAAYAGITRDSASGALNRLAKSGLVRRVSGTGVEPTRFFLVADWEDVPVLLPVRSVGDEELPQATEAYDKGWLAGYEQGRVAGVKEAESRFVPVKLEYRRGFEAGKVTGANVLGTNVLTLVGRMQQEMRTGAPVHLHSKTCWKQSPACALNSVRKLVEREMGITETADVTAPYVMDPRKMAKGMG